jgi:hypothetical protein
MGVDGGLSRCPRHVVLCDDSEDIRELLEMMLRSRGVSVSCVADGRSAIRAIAETRPVAAIVDIALADSELDGIDVARAVRRHFTTWSGTLIALTGYGDSQSRQAALDAGFDDFLVKPANIEDLLAAISQDNVVRSAHD